jgi:hypothetical protein
METQNPQGSRFKISGLQRRQLKKELAELRLSLKLLYYHNDIDTVYGGGQTQEELEQTKLRWEKEIEEIKLKLNEQHQ